jgi:hypothetical protein
MGQLGPRHLKPAPNRAIQGLRFPASVDVARQEFEGLEAHGLIELVGPPAGAAVASTSSSRWTAPAARRRTSPGSADTTVHHRLVDGARPLRRGAQRAPHRRVRLRGRGPGAGLPQSRRRPGRGSDRRQGNRDCRRRTSARGPDAASRRTRRALRRSKARSAGGHCIALCPKSAGNAPSVGASASVRSAAAPRVVASPRRLTRAAGAARAHRAGGAFVLAGRPWRALPRLRQGALPPARVPP